jgi:fibronectin type 3 domain-containing protein
VASHSLIIKSKTNETVDTIASYRNTSKTQFIWREPKIGEWQFFVVAKDSSGNTSLSQQVFEHKIQVDFSEYTPTLKAQANYNEGGIVLEFSATAEANLIILYRLVNDNPPRIFKTLPAQTKNYVDNSVVVGKKYKYFIKLVTQNGKESGFSKEVEINF